MKKKEYNRHLKRWALGTLRRFMKSSEVAQFVTSRGTFFLVAARVFKVAQFCDFVCVDVVYTIHIQCKVTKVDQQGEISFAFD